jgi:N-acetylglucosaminyldiphosphoundecaprenol N-acetyl-beta-D-mannosaminyltransferase
MSITSPARIELLGVGIDRVSLKGAVDFIAASLARGSGGWVITPNLDILRRLVLDPEFRLLCAPTELRLADGMPLVWASRLQLTPLPERAAGSDLIWELCGRAARDGRSVFFLGGNPGAAEAAARTLQARSPDLKIAGTECPPMGFETDPDYMKTLTDRLVASSPDIVLVALGSPKQERLIVTLRPRLGRAWFLGIGVSFSFVSGEIKRAPSWMRRTGLEWVHRLAQEPSRLARRYLVHGIPFAIRLLGGSLWKGLRGGGARAPAVEAGPAANGVSSSDRASTSDKESSGERESGLQ